MSQPLPTSQSLEASGQLITASLSFLRLRWFLRDPAATALSVLDSAVDPASPQQPFYAPDGTVHPVAASPASDPPVSVLRVTILPLDHHAEDWDDGHNQHEGAEFDGPKRVRCCGEERPGPGPFLDVVAADGFVTVGEYVAAVHPWVMGLEGEIRRARGAVRCRPLGSEFEMFVYPNRPHHLDVRDMRGAGRGWLEGQWKMVARVAQGKVARARAAEGGGEGV